MELTGGSEPAWSPDRTKIAFSSSSDGEMIVHIGVMDADGKNRLKFEDHATQPSWSPDGQRLHSYLGGMMGGAMKFT